MIHGEKDNSVPLTEGREIASWLHTELQVISNTEHTFGSSHPWKSDQLPEALKEICELTVLFFNQPINHLNLEKESLVADLIKLAKSDSELRDIEYDFLHTLAEQIGITTADFEELFEKYISFNPPKLEADRIVQFQRLMLLMNVDQNTSKEELNYIRSIGIRMGLNPRATDELLRIMPEYENQVIPPEKLISIFKTFHN